MRVLLTGATGMVGDGLLHECLRDPRVTDVLAVGRSPLGVTHPKLREHRRTDFFDLADLEPELRAADGCAIYAVVGSLYPVLRRIAPAHVTTAEHVGRAMIAVAAGGFPKRVLENPDINAAGQGEGGQGAAGPDRPTAR